jgi:hypothetical protein
MKKTDKVYNVYRWFGSHTDCVAVIKGDQITGEYADNVRKILLEGTSYAKWPDDPPTIILCGDYLWAAEVEDDSESE